MKLNFRDEVDSLAVCGGPTHFHFMNKIEIEKPSYLSIPLVVLIYSIYSGRKPYDFFWGAAFPLLFRINFSLSFPIHFRYHLSSSTESFTKIYLPPPLIYLSCSRYVSLDAISLCSLWVISLITTNSLWKTTTHPLCRSRILLISKWFQSELRRFWRSRYVAPIWFRLYLGLGGFSNWQANRCPLGDVTDAARDVGCFWNSDLPHSPLFNEIQVRNFRKNSQIEESMLFFSEIYC